MFSESRYAPNGDLRIAYRATREGPRDIVFVPNWMTTWATETGMPCLMRTTPSCGHNSLAFEVAR